MKLTQEQIAKAILGPRADSLPPDSRYEAEDLREHRWKIATEQERKVTLWAAGTVLALIDQHYIEKPDELRTGDVIHYESKDGVGRVLSVTRKVEE